jgi:integrase
VGRMYKFASRRLGWSGTVPTSLLLSSERPKISQAKRRPIFVGDELEQTIAAAHEPFRTLFAVAALTGARISELCGLTWADVRIDDLDEAEIEFGWQVDRHGNRGPTKTDGSARTCRSRGEWRWSLPGISQRPNMCGHRLRLRDAQRPTAAAT